jgi:hypothetical protein
MPHSHENDTAGNSIGHDEHEDGFLCSLSLDALLSLLLSAFMGPNPLLAQGEYTASTLVTAYIAVSLLFPAILDPPPVI